MADISEIPRRWPYKLYVSSVIVAGALISVFCASRLNVAALDARFAIIIGITLLISSRIIIPIPRFSAHISISDTFIFLTLLLYGTEAAVLLAGAEALLSSRRFSKKASTILFNAGCGALSAFITAQALHAEFGDVVLIRYWPFSATLIAATCTMALVQYAANSGLVALCGALKANLPFWPVWRKHFLWTSITSCGRFRGRDHSEVGGPYGLLRSHSHCSYARDPLFHVPHLSKECTSRQQRRRNRRSNTSRSSPTTSPNRNESANSFPKSKSCRRLANLLPVSRMISTTRLQVFSGAPSFFVAPMSPEKIQRGLEIIIKAAEDGANTVKRIQDFASNGRIRTSSWSPLIKYCLMSARLRDRAGKTAPRRPTFTSPWHLKSRSKSKVMGDESELRDVLVNMVFNAVDAMPKRWSTHLKGRRC